MYDDGGGAWLPPISYSCWGATSREVCCKGRAWLPTSKLSGWGAAVCVVCCEGGAWPPLSAKGGRGVAACIVCCWGGTWLPPMTNSGFPAASASVSCGNGGGGAGIKVNDEDVLGCWAGVSAHSSACPPCELPGDAPLQSVGGMYGGRQAGAHVLGGRCPAAGPSQGGGPPYAHRWSSDGRRGEFHRKRPCGGPVGPRGGLHQGGPCGGPAGSRSGHHRGGAFGRPAGPQRRSHRGGP